MNVIMSNPIIEKDSAEITGMCVTDGDGDGESKGDSNSMALTIDSWDQIGTLTSELASSAMAKQASILSKRFANDNKDTTTTTNRSCKRRKVEINTESVLPNETPGNVTSEEGSSVVSLAGSNSSEEPLDDDSYCQIDRLGRMSRLMIQMEYYHKQLRDEMISMAKDNDLEC
jgi:hypothetical protein